MTETISKLEYPGLRPQRFHGGRKHLRSIDTLDGNMQTNMQIEKGRKHYAFNPTKNFEYKSGIKVGFPKNISSNELLFRGTNTESDKNIKKLVFIPPQKRIRIGFIKLSYILSRTSQLPSINSTKIHRLTSNQKEKIEQISEDKRAVMELDIWENQFTQMK